MRRRSFLAAAGLAAAGLAGCASSSARTVRTPPATTGDRVADGDLELTLERVHRGLVRLTYPDAIGVTDRARRHVALAVNAGKSKTPPPEKFSLRFDGEEHAPMSIDSPGEIHRYWGESFHTADDPGGWLLFDLPTSGDASDAALAWPGSEWPLSTTLQRRLGGAPAFDVSVTATAETVDLTTANTGDRPQQFLVAANQSGPMYYAPIGTRTALLEGGGTETFEFTPSSPAATDKSPSTARLTFTWVDGDAERSVEVA